MRFYRFLEDAHHSAETCEDFAEIQATMCAGGRPEEITALRALEELSVGVSVCCHIAWPVRCMHIVAQIRSKTGRQHAGRAQDLDPGHHAQLLGPVGFASARAWP